MLLRGEVVLDIKKAQAAEDLTDNLAYARQVVEELAPTFDQGNSDNILSVNFAPEGYLAKPLIAETQVTQEERSTVRTIGASRARQSLVNQTPQTAENLSGSRSFPYGYCTYYVSQRRNIPWSGNAISWLAGANVYGFATGSTPQTGAIVVTSEGGWTGHVGMVDAVNGDQITISEMNYNGWGVVSQRTISSSYGPIMGYIY